MPVATIYLGDVLKRLSEIPEGSVRTCVTSPPYWGLRDYGTADWEGGDPECSHKRDSKHSESTSTGQKLLEGAIGDGIYKTECKRCGAIRKDLQLGLEETPEEYVENMVRVFREVKRVLSEDGTVWLNLGDSYFNTQNSNRNGSSGTLGGVTRGGGEYRTQNRHAGSLGLKQKDLVGIPWRVALALQQDGWYLRQDIIWAKPNPMPESVTDRCTKGHEYVFLLSKSPRYFFDNEAIKEPVAEATVGRSKRGVSAEHKNVNGAPGQTKHTMNQPREYDTEREAPELRNKRDVWYVATKAFKGAHFAVMPEALVEPCVLAGSAPDDTVLDPFTGSGTVAVVALRFGRNFVGTELNPEYAEIAENRISGDAPLLNTVIVKKE